MCSFQFCWMGVSVNKAGVPELGVEAGKYYSERFYIEINSTGHKILEIKNSNDKVSFNISVSDDGDHITISDVRHPDQKHAKRISGIYTKFSNDLILSFNEEWPQLKNTAWGSPYDVSVEYPIFGFYEKEKGPDSLYGKERGVLPELVEGRSLRQAQRPQGTCQILTFAIYCFL